MRAAFILLALLLVGQVAYGADYFGVAKDRGRSVLISVDTSDRFPTAGLVAVCISNLDNTGPAFSVTVGVDGKVGMFLFFLRGGEHISCRDADREMVLIEETTDEYMVVTLRYSKPGVTLCSEKILLTRVEE